jgi:hypothetical protein
MKSAGDSSPYWTCRRDAKLPDTLFHVVRPLHTCMQFHYSAFINFLDLSSATNPLVLAQTNTKHPANPE